MKKKLTASILTLVFLMVQCIIPCGFQGVNAEQTGNTPSVSNSTTPSGISSTNSYITDRYIVKYKDNNGDKGEKGREGLKKKLGDKLIKSKKVRSKRNFDQITIKTKEKPEDFIAEVKKDNPDSIEFIQPDYELELCSNDAYFSGQWGMSNGQSVTDSGYGEKHVDVNVVPAWEVSQGEGVTVAVIDTGIDTAHEDLSGSIWTNTKEIPSNGIDDDGNGFIDDVNGWDFANDTNKVHDQNAVEDERHGTHIAGIIAAVKDNGKGVAGVAPKSKIMPLKVFRNGIAYTSDIIEAIEYAEKNGAKIVNCSWGTLNDNQLLKETMEYSSMLFVCAAGNSGTNLDQYHIYPASYGLANVINVAAVNKNGTLSIFSDYGLKTVDIAAPGEDIMSTLPNNTYGQMSGTSMAAPFVSGAASLLISKNPSITNISVKRSLTKSVTTLEELKNFINSGGILNIKGSLAESNIGSVEIGKNIPTVTNSAINQSTTNSAINQSTTNSAINQSTTNSAIDQSKTDMNLMANYSAQILSNTIPDQMETGRSYQVSITVINTGSIAWTSTDGCKLGAVGDNDPFASGRQFLTSGEAIAAGQTKTFTFTMIAPFTPGSYTTDWQMLQEGYSWFGDTLTKQVNVTQNPYGAQKISDTIPSQMEAGKSYAVSITVKNIGANTWTAADGCRLGAVGDNDPFASGRQLLTSGEAISTSQTKTFTFTMTAPAAPGVYTTDWKMLKEGYIWFGDTITQEVNVIPNSFGAQIISDTIPTQMETGRSYQVSITIKNTGSNVWTETDSYRLGAVGNSDPLAGWRQYLTTGEAITIGQTKTFTFTMTAPVTTGVYTTDWQMLKEGYIWFGDKLTKQVNVIQNPYGAQIIRDTIPAQMEAGKTYTVSVTVKNTGSNTWTTADSYRLGGVGNSDPFGYWRQYLTTGEAISAGQTKTFTFTMTAPAVPGIYTTDWQMLKEYVCWFGDTLTKKVLVIGKAENSITVNCINNNQFDIVLSGKSVQDFSQKSFILTYDPNVLTVVDLCASTIEKDISVGNIEGTDITVLTVAPGVIELRVNKTVPQGDSWSGVINIITFIPNSSVQTKIVYSVGAVN